MQQEPIYEDVFYTDAYDVNPLYMPDARLCYLCQKRIIDTPCDDEQLFGYCDRCMT